ncbi:DUF6076 domain-containing protein [Acetobacterium bakii]|uniref:Uncharacterized protein n=1 Tax=Acetobacterium bakii TaxID=52689 RepID=A0A0L6U0X0_9FIRM|nr:DUF6076 domain-containing protein [Acetobacterium bakii]KNZ41445.1 hypothetical protein AKG39_11785 [Acetobacterium bakii]
MYLDGLSFIEDGSYTFLFTELTGEEKIQLIPLDFNNGKGFGNVLVDLANLNFERISFIIRNLNNAKDDCNEKNLETTLEILNTMLVDEFGFICGSLIQSDFFCLLSDYIKNKNEFIKTLHNYNCPDGLFKDTDYDDWGDRTIEHLLLSILPAVGTSLAACHKISSCIAANEDLELVVNLFTKLINNQRIDYKISVMGGKITPIYKVHNIFSMISIEVSKILEKDIDINICNNCKKFFIPLNRSDTQFCDNVSPQDENKTCKEYGRYINYLTKTQNDLATKLYKQIYNSKANKAKRTRNIIFQNDLNKFRLLAKKYKNRIKLGEITEDEYIIWLKDQKLGNKED